jgi:hypothetical protein
MTAAATQGTSVPALESLTGQAITWGLAIAVAVLVVSAAGWAIAHAGQHPAAAARAKTGMAVAVVGALLLGAGRVYIGWLDQDQAAAFAGSPAAYAVPTGNPAPGFEIIDPTDDWAAAIDTIRAAKGLPPFGTDTTLKDLARGCAESMVGGPGRCPMRQQYQATTISPATFGTLEQNHPPNAGDPATGLLDDYTKLSDDVRVAWVAVRNTTTFRTVLVLMFADGPCANRCVIDNHGTAIGLIARITP